VHIGRPADADPYDRAINVSHRRLELPCFTEHLVQDCHLWQPWRIGCRRRDLWPRVLTLGQPSLGFLPRARGGRLLPGGLEFFVERLHTGFGAFVNEVPKVLGLDGIEVADKDKAGKKIDDAVLGPIG
jgi:hypothetical protein